jgi:transposase
MHCIGVDVSKQELVTYDGVSERVFPNTPGLAAFRRFVGSASEAIIVFEPTSTYSRRLEKFCRTQKIACCQLNPRVVPHYRQVGKGRSKTDKTDAELLYRYGTERGQEEAGQLMNDALAQAVAARLACHRVVQKARVAYQGLLDALEHDPATEKGLLSGLRREVAELKLRETRQLEEARAVVAADADAAKRLNVLLSIPGIGPMTALTLLALFRKYPGVNRQQLVALGGLDPIQIQSGTSVHGKSRISKRGNREARKCLFEATLSAARFNPGIRAIYRRLKAEGKPDKVARIAAARKLLLLAHAIYESGDPFRLPVEEVS